MHSSVFEQSPFPETDPRHLDLLNKLKDEIASEVSGLPKDVDGGILVFKVHYGRPEEDSLESTFVPIEHCSVRTLESYGFPRDEAMYASQVVDQCEFPRELLIWFCELVPGRPRRSFVRFALRSSVKRKFNPYHYRVVLN